MLLLRYPLLLIALALCNIIHPMDHAFFVNIDNLPMHNRNLMAIASIVNEYQTNPKTTPLAPTTWDDLNQNHQTTISLLCARAQQRCIDLTKEDEVSMEQTRPSHDQHQNPLSLIVAHNQNQKTISQTQTVQHENTMYSCKYCDRTFNKKAQKTVHERSHTTIISYLPAPAPQYRTNVPSITYTTLVNPHENPETPLEDSFHCEKGCKNRVYPSEKGLNNHYKLEHRVRKGFSCPDCLFDFPTDAALQDHKRIYHTATGHLCSICCHKQYADSRHLKLHQVKKHGESFT